MAIILSEENLPARITKAGVVVLELKEGRVLIIDSQGDGHDLEIEVPQDKKWTVNIYINIIETDA